MSNITHDVKNQKFFVIIDGLESYLGYVKTNDTLNLVHTFVPSVLRGKGIAAKLVEAALQNARKNAYKIIPSCSYVSNYIEQHPEFADLIAQP